MPTLVPREYPIEDQAGNRYQPLGVALGQRGVVFNSSSHAQRVAINCAPKGTAIVQSSVSVSLGRPRKLTREIVRQPEITLLYEVPEEATQFELQHHALRHVFRLEDADAAR
jgi:hypothetical protein